MSVIQRYIFPLISYKQRQNATMGDSGVKKAGRPKAIVSPEKMWELFKQYREEKKNDPIIVIDYKGKDAERVEMPHQRP